MLLNFTRYSLINLEESLENDLDAILGELCVLESNFNTTNSQLEAGYVKIAHYLPCIFYWCYIMIYCFCFRLSKSEPPSRKVTPPGGVSCDTPTDPPPPPAPLQLEELLATEPQYISPESVRQNKQANLANNNNNSNNNGNGRTDSPDADSAFCENTSSNSSNGSAQQQQQVRQQQHQQNRLLPPPPPTPPPPLLSSSSPSQTSTLQRPISRTTSASDAVSMSSTTESARDAAARAKAEKIRLAIEKIREASIKKIFIKVFGEDGSAKSLLVDERMSVAQVCRTLADKNHVVRDSGWGLVELLPDLHMERAYEDHEGLVENLLMWKADSKNTLWFIKRPEVYDLFNRYVNLMYCTVY